MKNNFLILSIFITGFLILPVFCFADVFYERTPSGYTITNPVSFDVGFDDYILDTDCNETDENWGLELTDETNEITYYPSECYSTTTFFGNFSIILPIGEKISLVGFSCGCELGGGNPIEGTGAEIIFEITDEGNGKILTLPETAIASTTGTIGDLFDAIGPFIWLFIGLPLAFVVISRILRIMP